MRCGEGLLGEGRRRQDTALPVSRQIYKQFASELSTCMAKQRNRPVSHETGMLCKSHLAATRSGYPICLALAGL